MAEKVDSAAPLYFENVFLHEMFMIFMQAQYLLRLLISTGITSLSLMYAAMLAGYLGLIWKGSASLSPWTNRLRLISNMIIMNVCFESIRYVVPALGKKPLDEYLVRVDSFLVGGDLSLWAQQFNSPILTEIMSIGYMCLFIFLTFSFIYYGFKTDLEKLCRFCMCIFTVYAIGITCYSIVPAQGPYVYFASDYRAEIEGFFLTRLNQVLVSNGSSVYDVFPSLHGGGGFCLLLFYKKEDPLLFRIWLIPFIIMILATIYLRYHYAIDLICGFLLTLVSIKMAEFQYKNIIEKSKEVKTCTSAASMN